MNQKIDKMNQKTDREKEGYCAGCYGCVKPCGKTKLD